MAESLDAVVTPVRDHHVPGEWIDANAPWVVELARLASELSPAPQVLALAGEVLDAMVRRIDDPEVLVLVQPDPSRAGELPWRAALFTPAPDALAIHVIDANVVGPVVGYEEMALAIEGETNRPRLFVLLVVDFALVLIVLRQAFGNTPEIVWRSGPIEHVKHAVRPGRHIERTVEAGRRHDCAE